MSRSWQTPHDRADEDFDGAPLLRREVALDEGHGAVVGDLLTSPRLGVVRGRR